MMKGTQQKYVSQQISSAKKNHTANGLSIQAKLTIGQPNDKYEQEADRIADHVMRMPDHSASSSNWVQKKCKDCEKEEDLRRKPLTSEITQIHGSGLQKKEEGPIYGRFKGTGETYEFCSNPDTWHLPEMACESPDMGYKWKWARTSVMEKCKGGGSSAKVESIQGLEPIGPCPRKEKEAPPKKDQPLVQAKEEATLNQPDPSLENRLSGSKNGGSPLPETTRSFMESRIGADFSNVKVHTGSDAVQMSQELGAQAFTHGNHVYFNSGKYEPESSSGKHLLAHELVHTVQQAGLKKRSRNDTINDLYLKPIVTKKKEVARQERDRTPKKITDDMLDQFSAVVLSEAYRTQYEKVAFIYYNLVKKLGWEKGLKRSRSTAAKTWMLGGENAKTKNGKVRRLEMLRIVKQLYIDRIHSGGVTESDRDKSKEFHETIAKVYAGWEGQGSLADFNLFNAQKPFGGVWNMARKYYELQRGDNNMPKLVEELPGDSELLYTKTFIYDTVNIVAFFNKNPDKLSGMAGFYLEDSVTSFFCNNPKVRGDYKAHPILEKLKKNRDKWSKCSKTTKK